MFFTLFSLSIQSRVIGIDLGTTFSVVGIYKNGEVEIIPNEINKKITPSVVSYYNGSRVVGDSAVRLGTISPETTVFAVKRLIGRKFSDPIVQQEMHRVPFTIVERDERPYIKISTEEEDTLISPEEISALVLKKLKQQAELYLNETIHEAVITVPAYFNEDQRKATITAGQIAGLKVDRIISEPTAAALAYGLNKEDEKYVIVYDLGGGTFDVSLLTLDKDYFQVVATGGDTHLGGEDFDEMCVQQMITRFMNATGSDCSRDPIALARLKKSCEAAKIRLSDELETEIEIPNFFEGQDLKETYTRKQFNDNIEELLQKTLRTIQGVIDDANLTKEDISDVVMIGGSTRSPRVREIVSEYFGGKKLCTEINPDEAVAYGAAIQGEIISSENFDVVVVDVYPLTLGVETRGGLMSPIIKRNTRIPCRRTKTYTTPYDDAAGARIEIFEGERPLTRDNRPLGIFELHNLPRAARGQLQIDVTFEIDANAILTVTAQEMSTKSMDQIQIDTLDMVLPQEEIDDAIEKAKIFSEEDAADRARVVARVEFEHSIDDVSNQLESEKDNPMLGKTIYNEYKDKIKALRKWIDEHPMEEPHVYEEKGENLRVEFAFLFHRGQLADL
ncbi:dnaK protein [Trichomonas vaginalis G3]|uniref:DnaK protein n=1 Tax=Trichomonas vaginalis (strain ATCC PRA-98 / G3) TaxID=412133 RepID=A2FJR4_TRIV3|nr:ATP binding [Trichomonas vaginalis G3]EAX94846.1 dnaK protein [Trichomonas vaginalis G3]KAI5485711.1 ATP binding [Trichomonas vaginalis G3]|eukprot:XP_001307776.1 dnaK protein [Trichomonas vaginalis G3]